MRREIMADAKQHQQLRSPSLDTTGTYPVLGTVPMYVGAIVGYGIGFFVSGIHDLEVPFIGTPFAENYRDTYIPGDSGLGFSLLSLFFCGHFAKRILEVIFVHIYRRQMPLHEIMGGFVYYSLFAVFIGMSLRPFISDQLTDFRGMSMGALIFVVGEIGNGVAHYKLRVLRENSFHKKDDLDKQQRTMPDGGMFEYIACPHYFFEIVAWTGFFIASKSLPALLFLIATAVVVTFKALKYHNQYKSYFDGKKGRKLYPANRKAIIPFVL